MRRRSFVAALSALLAGCSGTSPATETRSPTGTATPPPTMTLDTTFTAAEATCAETTEPSATVTTAAGLVEVTGRLVAPTPCHDARLGDATLADGTLRVAVETVDPPPDVVCAQCVATIEYEATVRLDAAPDRVVVTHDDEVVATASP